MEINTLTYNPSQLNDRQREKVVPVADKPVTVSEDKKSVKVSSEELLEKITSANKSLEKLGQGVTFSVDESTNASVIQLIDRNTNEVIKQYPNEGALKVLDNIQKYLSSVQESGVSSKENLTGSLINEII